MGKPNIENHKETVAYIQKLEKRIAYQDTLLDCTSDNVTNYLNKLLLDSLPHPAMLINSNRIILATNKIAEEVVEN